MGPGAFAAALAAGAGAGLSGYLTGQASIISYPVLLALGLPPVTANATSTVGLIATGMGSTVQGVRSFLPDVDRHRLGLQLIGAAAGGVAGALLLLVGGQAAFSCVVPWLVVLSSALLLVAPRLKRMQHGRAWPGWAHGLAIMLVFVYCGYFGAGAGLMYVTVTLIATRLPLGRIMYVKALLIAVTNLTAALCFVVSGAVDWPAAVALAIGAFAGGSLGPVLQPRIPERVLRRVMAAAGLVLAIWLWTRA